MVEMTGRLWYDSSKGKRSLVECVEAAQASHRRLIGGRGTVCYINPGEHLDAPAEVDGVQIRRLKTVSPGYYWIGRNGTDEPAAEPEAEKVEAIEEAHADEPELIDTCPHCDAEQLILSPANICWSCQRDMMREAA